MSVYYRGQVSLLSNRVGDAAGPKPRRGLSLLQGEGKTDRQTGLAGISAEAVRFCMMHCPLTSGGNQTPSLSGQWTVVLTELCFNPQCFPADQTYRSKETGTMGREKRQVPTTFESNERSAVLYTTWMPALDRFSSAQDREEGGKSDMWFFSRYWHCAQ